MSFKESDAQFNEFFREQILASNMGEVSPEVETREQAEINSSKDENIIEHIKGSFLKNEED